MLQEPNHHTGQLILSIIVPIGCDHCCHGADAFLPYLPQVLLVGSKRTTTTSLVPPHTRNTPQPNNTSFMFQAAVFGIRISDQQSQERWEWLVAVWWPRCPYQDHRRLERVAGRSARSASLADFLAVSIGRTQTLPMRAQPSLGLAEMDDRPPAPGRR